MMNYNYEQSFVPEIGTASSPFDHFDPNSTPWSTTSFPEFSFTGRSSDTFSDRSVSEVSVASSNPSIIVDRRPDLTVLPQNARITRSPDGQITIDWAVTNTRTQTRGADVAAMSFYNRFWLSGDPAWDPTDPQITIRDIPVDDDYYKNQQGIAMGETSPFRMETFRLPDNNTRRYLILSVNWPNNIGESDYLNNFTVFDLEGVIPDNPDRNPYNPGSFDYCRPETLSFSSEVELHSGAIIETHTLASYQSLGLNRALTLRYSSLHADPRPIVHFGYEGVIDAPGDAQEQLLVARLSVQRGNFSAQLPGYQGNQYGLTGGEHFWSVPDTSQPQRVQAALQLNLRDQASGVYQYTLQRGIQTINPAAPQFGALPHSSQSSLVSINRINSPFGHGWSLAGLQELIINPDNSVLLIDGDGTFRVFQPPTNFSGIYQSPNGDYSQLERLSDGTFRRTLKDQTVYTFNVNHKLAEVRDRNGNTTRYQYNASGQLTQIIDPVGLTTVFTYK